MTQSKLIQIPIYKSNLHLLIGDLSQLKEYIKEKFDRDYEGDNSFAARAIIIQDTAPLELILIFKSWNNSYGVLAHECVHLVNYIFQNLGIKHDTNNDEPTAYLLEYLFDLISDELNK